jgi:hypothetical protein
MLMIGIHVFWREEISCASGCSRVAPDGFMQYKTQENRRPRLAESKIESGLLLQSGITAEAV